MYMIGIKNRNNNCFISSALQILLNLDCLENLPGDDQLGGYLYFYLDLVRNYRSRSNNDVSLDLGRFYDFLVDEGMVKRNQQGDCHEFLLLFIDRVSRSMRAKYHNTVKVKAHGCVTLEDFFEGTIQKIVVCDRCQKKNISRERFSSLPLEQSIESSLEMFCQATHIDGYQCESCYLDTGATIYIKITRMPVVLSFHVNVKQPRTIRLSTLYKINTDNYSLYATVHHQGTHQGGHYYCRIIKNGIIYDINDQHVIKAPLSSEHMLCASDIVSIFYVK